MSRHDVKYLSWRIWTEQREEKEERAAKKEAERQRELDAWQLLLVNWEHPLGEEFEVERVRVADNQYVDARIEEPLNRMLADAKEEGIGIRIVSGYRSYKRQVKLYENKIRRLKRQGYPEEEAAAEAGTVVAVPGTSEHMTGLAVDLADRNYPVLEEEQEDTAAYQWLVEHCAEYGFIVRYPQSKKELTGIIYEPWHFRYVGAEHAAAIMENGWCLEEYLEQYEPPYEQEGAAEEE